MNDDVRHKSGLGWLVGWATFVFLVILAAYLLVELVPSDYLGGVDRVRIVSERISTLAGEAWGFGRPILQLLIVLAILEWILKRAGLRLDLSSLHLSADIRAVLALLVVVAFALAALSGGAGSASLKDVCLVVVGFYFGGLTKDKAAGASNIEGGSA